MIVASATAAPCTSEQHERAKATARWFEFRAIGVMDAGDGEQLEMRNCPDCHSTLCKVVEIEAVAS